MKIATAFVEIRPDTKRFQTDLDRDVVESARRTQLRLGDVLAGGAALAGAKKLTDAASNLEQAVGGTAAVFGASSRAVDQWAKNADQAAGLSERAARELTSQVGGLLKGFGFTVDEAAEKSIELAQLGADLAATFGGTTEDAVNALGAALRGEFNPLERYGVALNVAQIEAYALANGMAESKNEIDLATRAQAALAIITERTADAQGQFAREADTAAGAAARAAAASENAAADMGEALLPIYTRIQETVATVARAIGALPEPVQTAGLALIGFTVAVRPARAAVEVLRDGIGLLRVGFRQVTDAQSAFRTGLSGVTRGMVAAAPIIAAAALAWDRYSQRKREVAQRTEALTQALIAQRDGLEGEADTVQALGLLQGRLGEILRENGADVNLLIGGIREHAEQLDQLGDRFNTLYASQQGGAAAMREALRDVGLAGTEFGDELLRLVEAGDLSAERTQELARRIDIEADAWKDASREADNHAAATEAAADKAGDAGRASRNFAEDLKDAKDAAKDAREEIDKLTDSFERQFDALLDAFNLERSHEDAVRDVARAQQRIVEIQQRAAQERERNARRVRDAREALADVEARIAAGDLKGEEAARALRDARERLADAQAEEVNVSRELADAHRSLEDSQIRVAETAAELEIRQREAAGETVSAAEAARIQAQHYGELAETLAPGSPLRTRLSELKAQLEDVAGTYEVEIAPKINEAAMGIAEAWWNQLPSALAPGPSASDRVRAGIRGLRVAQFHDGIDRVPGLPGQEVLAVLEAGERVVPASENQPGGMGQTINLTIVNPIAEPPSESIRAARLAALELAPS